MAQPSDTNERFREQYPEVWRAFADLAEACHDSGPLDERSRRIAKLAIAIGAGLEGATHSAVRHALDAGISRQELAQIAMLAITTIGFPTAMRAMTWIDDLVPEKQSAKG